MRWRVVHPGPNFSVADVYTGWVEALEDLGETVQGFNLDERLAFYDNTFMRVGEDTFRKAVTPEKAIELSVNGLYATLYKTHPDVLFIITGFLIPHELLDLARFRGTKVVLLHTEQPYELDRELEIAAHADLNLVNDPTHLEAFRAAAPTEYMPHAYRPKLHCPGPAEPQLKCDLAFVGTGFESRIAFFEAMDLDGLDVLLAGHWQNLSESSPLRQYVGHDVAQCLDNADAVRIYRSAKAGLNLYRREANAPEYAAGWSCGPREIEMAATGLFFLRDPRPESDRLFPMLPTFAGPEDAGEQLRWWLEHDQAREQAA